MKHLPRIFGIAPPSVRREVAADVVRSKKECDPPGQRGTTSRLKFKRGSGHDLGIVAHDESNTDRMHPQ